ncbi:MAG: PAS domain S-box protein [Rhodospirillales bacterium]|nr:PAS domain S-box protein [Rhodospirillales bacterium]
MTNAAPGSKPRPLFPAAGGELSKLIAGFDWSSTVLGPISGWSETLRATTDLILRSPIPIVTLWEADGIMIYNDAYSEFAGGRHPQLLGMKVREGWSEVADFNDNVMRVGLAGGTLSYKDQELTLHRRGKPEQVWMNLDYSAIIGSTGKPVGVIAIVVETSAKVLAQRELSELNRELESRIAERTAERDRVWRYSPDMLAVVSAEGKFLAVNPAWKAVLGYEPNQVVGRNYIEFVHEENITETRQVFESLMARTQLSGFENKILHQDGSLRHISWSTQTEGSTIFAYGRDITGEKLQAEALRRAEEQLRQSQKMEAIGQLTGGVAHDFNNLLTVIRSSAELLGRSNLTEEKRQRYIAAIADSSDRAAKLTSQLLAFSRRQTLLAEIFLVNTCIQELADITSTIVGSHIEIELSSDCDDGYVEVDRGQFETAIVNIVVNARDAMNGQGHIQIHIHEAGAFPGKIEGLPYLGVSISDNGSGIPQEHLNRIFEPFFTTKEIGKGTGLGLSQVYGFVKQSGGDIEVKSGPTGSVFTIYLPRHAPPLLQASSSPEKPQQNFSGKVLLVEDNPQVANFAYNLLQDLGYEVTQADSAETALEILEEHEAAFDLVFSDVVMPGIGGIELAKRVREKWPALPLILTSGYSHVLANEVHHEFDLLHKPYSVSDLLRMIERAGTVKK